MRKTAWTKGGEFTLFLLYYKTRSWHVASQTKIFLFEIPQLGSSFPWIDKIGFIGESSYCRKRHVDEEIHFSFLTDSVIREIETSAASIFLPKRNMLLKP